MFKKFTETIDLIKLEIVIILLYTVILFFMPKDKEKTRILAELRDIIFLKNLDYKKESPFDKYFTK